MHQIYVTSYFSLKIANMNVSIIYRIKEYLKTQPVQKAWVFGSFSRGEEREDSDIDLLVQYDRTNQKVGLFTIIKIQQQLQQIVGRNVDLVEDGTLMPFAVQSANNDKILIYERSSIQADGRFRKLSSRSSLEGNSWHASPFGA